jgi:hypothetical protein
VLLIRRHPRRGEPACYRCYCPTAIALGTPTAIAGRRWAIEESFQAAKGPSGLDQHQFRRCTPWRRWALIAMLAHAPLTVLAATE